MSKLFSIFKKTTPVTEEVRRPKQYVVIRRGKTIAMADYAEMKKMCKEDHEVWAMESKGYKTWAKMNGVK